MKKHILKTKYFYWILIMVASVLFQSCIDLEIETGNAANEKTFFKTKSDADQALAASYAPLRRHMNGYFGAFTGYQNLICRGDDVWTNLNEDSETWKIATFTNTSMTGRNDFEYLYLGIQRANVFLGNIDNVPASELNEDERLLLKAEAHFLRGFQYFLLVTNYRNAPLRIIDAYKDPQLMIACASEATLWTQVEDDFTVAINSNLPIKRSSEQLGRIEKGAVIAMLGKALLTQKKYKDARETFEIIMKAPYQYQLVDDYEHNFLPTTEFNSESVYELNYIPQGTPSWGDEGNNQFLGMVIPQFIGSVKTGGWFKYLPSAFIVDEFIKEKRDASADTNFDKRMYSSMMFNRKDFIENTAPEDRFYANLSISDIWESVQGKIIGGYPDYPTDKGKSGIFMLKKYTNYYLNSDTPDSMVKPENGANNYRVMRYAEVLLLHAEACYFMKDYTAADADLQLIRNRAGLPTKSFTVEADCKKEIEHQHLLEFFGEGLRFDFLKRWYTPEQIKEIFVANKKQGAQNFKAKHFYYPIPEAEIQSNSKATQNELWK